MVSKLKFYNTKKGYGYIENPNDPEKAYFFHISDVKRELSELFAAYKYEDEPVSFEARPSEKKPGQFEAYDVNLDLNSRSVGHITEFDKGYGWIKEYGSDEMYFMHHSKLKGSMGKFISVGANDPVVFTPSENEKGKEALDVVKIDTRCPLEVFAEFDDFRQSLYDLKSLAEPENWDYITKPTEGIPVIYSYINHTFERIMEQNKGVEGKSSKDSSEYLYFNTGLVTPYQDEIYGYFEKIQITPSEEWGLSEPVYKFLEFETDQSRYRKYFPNSPTIASYFSEAEVHELIFDTSLNTGKVIIDKEHIKNRKARFPDQINQLDDEHFFDAIEKSIELAVKRIKRNYKTAIPHSYEGKIQFLLPLCMLSKKDADLALVVNKEEHVYQAHTVLTLDQAYNNARLLAKPDREWLNP
ncbi:DUF3825 domain-containing protein [Reichenbachiella sp.]|uniref:DUF3825 domain-containing protein n=1 Tax=Reichenbachiella sp. TaxID=2184521 RepID=UPI003B59A5D6